MRSEEKDLKVMNKRRPMSIWLSVSCLAVSALFEVLLFLCLSVVGGQEDSSRTLVRAKLLRSRNLTLTPDGRRKRILKTRVLVPKATTAAPLEETEELTANVEVSKLDEEDADLITTIARQFKSQNAESQLLLTTETPTTPTLTTVTPKLIRKIAGNAARPKVRPITTESSEEEEQRPNVETVRRFSHVNPDGSFTFGYENADGSFKEETRGTDCVVRGKYGYIDPDGVKREFTYVQGNPCLLTDDDDEQDNDFEDAIITTRRPVKVIKKKRPSKKKFKEERKDFNLRIPIVEEPRSPFQNIPETRIQTTRQTAPTVPPTVSINSFRTTPFFRPSFTTENPSIDDETIRATTPRPAIAEIFNANADAGVTPFSRQEPFRPIISSNSELDTQSPERERNEFPQRLQRPELPESAFSPNRQEVFSRPGPPPSIQERPIIQTTSPKTVTQTTPDEAVVSPPSPSLSQNTNRPPFTFFGPVPPEFNEFGTFQGRPTQRIAPPTTSRPQIPFRPEPQFNFIQRPDQSDFPSRDQRTQDPRFNAALRQNFPPPPPSFRPLEDPRAGQNRPENRPPNFRLNETPNFPSRDEGSREPVKPEGLRQLLRPENPRAPERLEGPRIAPRPEAFRPFPRPEDPRGPPRQQNPRLPTQSPRAPPQGFRPDGRPEDGRSLRPDSVRQPVDERRPPFGGFNSQPPRFPPFPNFGPPQEFRFQPQEFQFRVPDQGRTERPFQRPSSSNGPERSNSFTGERANAARGQIEQFLG
ncbi:uncharacterized protein LOC136028048 isoform X8 [Artemia franciscana]|uniref:uncharacterized protein LOC136028048 isoform X8 n=1 Tax=Artemia franciscana TaxID=6661 RepID=UPI0032DBC9F9